MVEAKMEMALDLVEKFEGNMMGKLGKSTSRGHN
jgi:hypothetical protein